MPDPAAEQRLGSRRGQQQEEGEHDRRVALDEGAPRGGTRHQRQSERPGDTQGQRPPLRPRPQVQLNAAMVDRGAEQAERGEREQHQGQELPAVTVAAGPFEHRRERRTDGGRRRPRRARAAQLEDEDRRPRKEEQPAGRHGGQAPQRRPLPVAQPDRQQPHRHHPGEEHRPVVREQRQPGDQPHRGGRRHGGGAKEPGQSDDPQRHEQHEERVHPRLRRIPHREGGDGREDEGGPSPPGPRGPCRKRQGGKGAHPEQAREGAHRRVAAPEDAHPYVQRKVVERRRAVVAKGVRDPSDGQAGDVDGQGLVQPQVGGGPEPEGHPGRDHDDGEPRPDARAVGFRLSAPAPERKERRLPPPFLGSTVHGAAGDDHLGQRTLPSLIRARRERRQTPPPATRLLRLALSRQSSLTTPLAGYETVGTSVKPRRSPGGHTRNQATGTPKRVRVATPARPTTSPRPMPSMSLPSPPAPSRSSGHPRMATPGAGHPARDAGSERGAGAALSQPASAKDELPHVNNRPAASGDRLRLGPGS